jgi:hypothetical protein
MYDGVEPGFAEHDLDVFERVEAELAWGRSLEVVRRAFRKDVDLEGVWESSVESTPPIAMSGDVVEMENGL